MALFSVNRESLLALLQRVAYSASNPFN